MPSGVGRIDLKIYMDALTKSSTSDVGFQESLRSLEANNQSDRMDF